MGSIDQTLSVPVVTPSKVELNIKSSRKRFCEETGSPAEFKIQCLVHAGSNPAKTTIAESFILGLKKARVVYELLNTTTMTVNCV